MTALNMTFIRSYAKYAFCSLLMYLTVFPGCHAQEQEYVIVNTTSGALRGILQDRVKKFFGVPFAEPPEGNLRFKKPVTHPGWTGVRDALQYADACVQQGGGFQTSEDCLYLDIYVPESNSTALPVMAWIHGGAFSAGSPSWTDLTSSEVLAAKGEVIVVGISYRLSILGFLPLDHEDTDLNVGLYDQRAGLLWIKQNIAAFGGDPGQITIFGESAGAMSVNFQVLSPLNKGLFQRAISQSGVGGSGLMVKESQMNSLNGLAKILQCQSETDRLVKCLKEYDADSLISEAIKFQYPAFPVIDGEFVLDEPVKIAKTSSYDKIPYMFSTTSEDGSLFFMFDRSVYKHGINSNIVELYWNAIFSGIDVMLRPEYKNLANQMAKTFYIADQSDPFIIFRGLLDFARDVMFVAPTMEMAGIMADNGVDVYMSIFNERTAAYNISSPITLGTAHGEDVLFVLGKMLLPLPGTSQQALEQLSDDVIEAWTSFAKGQSPYFTDAENNVVHLPKYTRSQRSYLEWTAGMTSDNIKTDMAPKAKSFWIDLLPSIYEDINKGCKETMDNGSLGLKNAAYKAIMVFLVAFCIMFPY